ncbi:MAG: response regulator transcription factor [Bacteroidetes bacterium]|nr:response regulator transcription factor [Bacteroidota bacterium]
MQINCLIVDDEPIARNGLMEHVRQIEFLHLVASCKSAFEATAFLQKNKIDLIYLDIQMPRLTGIDFIKNLKNPPLIIFTTAYPQYAIEGFELDILDYLLKPISFTRFYKSAIKAFEYLSKINSRVTKEKGDFFFLKSNQKLEKIYIKDILYIEGMSNYVIVHTQQKKHIAYLTFKSIEDKLPFQQFIRIHKSFLVSISAIESVGANEVNLKECILPIGKTYREDVKNRIETWLFKR